MEELADGVHLLDGRPRYAINVYLVGDVLIDAGTDRAAKRILSELRGRTVSAHALTHAHLDHFGSSHEVCEALGVPLWCGEADAEAVETGKILRARSALEPLLKRAPPPAPHPVARRLVEGDEVGGFEVIATPGHSAGHVSYWRESDRTLVLGDVLFGMKLVPPRKGLREPPTPFTPDPSRNRDSARRVAAFDPALVCFGHGPPLRDTRRFKDFAAGLPA